MPSTRLAIVVVLLVVLAGCSNTGTTSPDEAVATPSATPTTSPTDSPTTEPTPATPEPWTFPAGTGEDGIENESALLRAHAEALRGVDHRVEATMLANRSDALRRPLDVTVHAGVVGTFDATYVDQRAEASPYGVVPHETYRRGPGVVRKTPQQDGSDRYFYRYDPGPDAVFYTAASRPLSMLNRVLGLGDFEYEGTTNAGGTTVLRFEADASDDDGVERYGATVRVGADGVVHGASGSYVVDPDHEPAYRVEFSYELQRDVGPPEPPGWVDEVPQPVAERIADGEVVALENRGDSALAAGTGIGVILPDREAPIRGNVTLPERLGPGETVYLYAVGADDGAEVRLAVDRPTDTDGFVDLTDRTVQVDHAGDDLRFRVRLPPENGTDG